MISVSLNFPPFRLNSQDSSIGLKKKKITNLVIKLHICLKVSSPEPFEGVQAMNIPGLLDLWHQIELFPFSFCPLPSHSVVWVALHYQLWPFSTTNCGHSLLPIVATLQQTSLRATVEKMRGRVEILLHKRSLGCSHCSLGTVWRLKETFSMAKPRLSNLRVPTQPKGLPLKLLNLYSECVATVQLSNPVTVAHQTSQHIFNSAGCKI